MNSAPYSHSRLNCTTGHRAPVYLRCASENAVGMLYAAASETWSSSRRNRVPNLASQWRTAFSSMVPKYRRKIAGTA